MDKAMYKQGIMQYIVLYFFNKNVSVKKSSARQLEIKGMLR